MIIQKMMRIYGLIETNQVQILYTSTAKIHSIIKISKGYGHNFHFFRVSSSIQRQIRRYPSSNLFSVRIVDQ